jgi:hypothetical protein
VTPALLSDGQQALFSAAINRPIWLASLDSKEGLALAQERLDRLKRRARGCLLKAEFGKGFDRKTAMTQLDAITLPILRPDLDGDQAGAEHPEREATEAFGWPALSDLPNIFARTAGANWRDTVKSARLSTSPSTAGLATEFATVVGQIEKDNATKLSRPLWSGDDHALVIGATVDERGIIVAQVSNAGSLAEFEPQPIASLAKLVAAIVRAPADTSQSRYVCPPSPECPQGGSYSAGEAFAHSKSATVFARLARGNSEIQVRDSFDALGWPEPQAGSARYDAAYGTLEVRPLLVLRGAAALNAILNNRPTAMPVPHFDTEIALTDDRVLTPDQSPLEPQQLIKLLATPHSRNFVATVLQAPIDSGTLRGLSAAVRETKATRYWGKTGTADSADRNSVRVVWNLVGISVNRHEFTTLVLVVGSNGKPLGTGFEASAITPLTAVMLRHATHTAEGGGRDGS